MAHDLDRVKDAERRALREARAGAMAFLRFARGFWTSAVASSAWSLAAGIVVLLGCNLAVNLGYNRWQRWFFDMLERKDVGSLWFAFGALAFLIISGAALAVAMVYCRMTLQIRWRAWMTTAMLERWAARDAGRAEALDGARQGSSEYRLVEDVRLAIDPLVELTIGFLNAAALGVTFAGILIAVGGAMTVEVFGVHVTVPGYLAVAAVVYAVLMSGWMYWVGQPLIRRMAAKNEAESQFLFALTQAAEGTPVDTSGSRAARFEGAARTFDDVVVKLRRVVREHCRLTWITNSHSFFAPILPLLLAAPKYLSGDLTLGAVMQSAAAFTIVLGALNWLTDNYVRFAEWSASARRVDGLRRALYGDAV